MFLQVPGIFTVTPNTTYDYDFPTENDGYTAQYLRDKYVRFTAGKMLGGASSIQHMVHVRGNRRDHQLWAEAANDKMWSFDHLLPFMKKSENVVDPEVVKAAPKYRGTSGNMGIARDPSDANKGIIQAFEELGSKYHIDFNGNISTGVMEPMYYIANDVRQSTAECYLSATKNRKNLHIFQSTTVTKILFDNKKNAIGVEALNSNNEKITIKAKKEVLVAAGVIRTPQLLMLSGIGPKSELNKFNIPVLSDLPVGQTFRDHVGVAVAFSLERSNATIPPANPKRFPTPTTVMHKALGNSEYPDFQAINLVFTHDNPGLLQLCSSVFKYNNDICNQMYKGNTGRTLLYSLVYLLQPKSTGTVTLRSTDPLDNPIIRTGYLSNPEDVDKFASALVDVAALVNTTYFKMIDAEIVNFDLKECNSLVRFSWDYWRCYGQAMSNTVWHATATAPLGTVLDKKLRVRGVKKLRVVDASGVPNLISGKVMAGVLAFAEKAADLVRKDQ